MPVLKRTAADVGPVIKRFIITWDLLAYCSPARLSAQLGELREARAEAMQLSEDAELPCPRGVWVAALQLTGAWLDATIEERASKGLAGVDAVMRSLRSYHAETHQRPHLHTVDAPRVLHRNETDEDR